jgi:aspartyl-tRNA(Asn)/glutamyl-tRNA(Gln) amidotransferase subunit A
MSETPLHFQSISELSTAIRERHLSPVTLAEHMLARIESLNPALHAFVTVTGERALAQAKAAKIAIDAGEYKGPLHGIPYVAKDLYNVRGLATRAGSRLLADNIAQDDCAAVARLRDAGMVLLGKTHTVQFAFGGVGINHDEGTPHNPWNEVAHAPGGSSSGTGVAVSSGLAPMGLGTDTGGSVRIPAALCGIAGLKTTVGRISRAGVYPLSATLDSVGPLARNVRDCALVYSALQGADPADSSTDGQAPHDVLRTLDNGVKGMRIAFAETAFWDDADPEVVSAVRATGAVFESLGAHVASIPFAEAGQVAGGSQERHRALFVAAEGCAYNARLLDEHFDELDPPVANRMINGRTMTAPQYYETTLQWAKLRQAAMETLRDVDALIVPTCPVTARPISEIDTNPDTYALWNGRYLRNTAIGNMLNLCGVSIPCGLGAGAMPIGLTVYAKPFAEDVALRVAHAYEQATSWHLQRPDLQWARG